MKRVFIFLHGASLPVFMQLNPKPEEPIVCGDSGVLLVKKLAYKPRSVVVIGDLDSVPPSVVAWCKKEGFVVEQHATEKDFTDGHLALLYACRTYPQGVEKVIVGGMSALLDHTLGNILPAVPLVEKGHQIRFVGERQRIYLGKGKIQIGHARGHTFSLIPLKDAVVKKTNGLKWKLEGEAISPYQSRTLRNLAVLDRVHIELSSGVLMVVESW